MDAEKIIEDLNKRFAAPLPEYYDRRIIFWYDEDEEFKDQLDEIRLDHAKLFVLTGNNNFEAKKTLTRDDTTSNYLVYCPCSFDRIDDDWLTDIKLYSENFRADLISIWMNEMGLEDTAVMRKAVKSFRKFFSAKDRRNRLLKFQETAKTPSHLYQQVMAAICNCKEPSADHIIRSVLEAGIRADENEKYQKLVTYGADSIFWSMAAQMTGYNEVDHDLGRFMTHILLTAATRTLPQEYLAGLDSFISTPHQAYCYDFIYDWLHSEESKSLYPLARFVEMEGKLAERFRKVPLDQLLDTECFPCINEVILTRVLKDVNNDLVNPDALTEIVEKRRTYAGYDYFKNFYDGILQVARMNAFYKDHAAGFHTVEPKNIWKEYTTEYYKMDSYYRLFQLDFQRTMKASNPLLDDLFKSVVEKVEGLYSNWFLGQLAENWTRMAADELRQYGHVLDVPQQTDFYQNLVEPAENRIFVIISDAMRYEVAVELAQELQQENQSKVELSSVEGIFPTITKFGMAALLPHQNLTAEEKGGKIAVLADGQSTDSTNRDSVLKNKNPKSVALKYTDLVAMKRSERNAAMKGMQVVYIYHDTIDESSHTSDSMVFSACTETIQEIKNVIRIITGDYGQGNFIITSDHGFLYTYSPLKEDSKVDKDSFHGMDVEYGRRYAIMKKGALPDYLLPVKFLDGKTEYEAFAPRENIRIKMSGGGMNFVHGGISLQEMVVPVIEYHHLRNSYAEYKNNKEKFDTKPVTVDLLSAVRKISNNLFTLNFYQKEPVGANREACNYLVYMTDSNGQKVSDEQRIIADKTSDDVKERTFHCKFSLKSLTFKSTEIYYLVIADESGLQMPVKEEFHIDLAFQMDGMDFF
jgi:uncharacterized protein (TIGR02687 family)